MILPACECDRARSVAFKRVSQRYQDVGKGRVSLRGVAFVALLSVLTVLQSTLPSFCLSCKRQDQEATMMVLTVLADSAVSVMTATPLKLNAPCPTS